MLRDELPQLPSRPVDAHKGTFGRVLLIGGSRGMAGSIALAARAAMRSGAGLGHVAVPCSILETVAAFEPCVMTHPLPDDAAGRLLFAAEEDIETLAGDKSAVGLGPGFSRADQAVSLALRFIETLPQPTVVDADALYGLASQLDVLQRVARPRVLTPHPGEFARLLGEPVPQDADSRRRLAEKFSKRFDNVVLVLKGAGTVITDGEQTVINDTGNPGMATAGSGDVLTGIVTALLGQGMSPFDAAVLGVHAHGRAGDVAARRLGQTALIASDIIDVLPEVWKRLE